jgi:hypothetical protein
MIASSYRPVAFAAALAFLAHALAFAIALS